MMPKTSGLRCSENFWYPAADVFKARGGWVVKVELAGVAPDELEVVISGDTLRISGVRRDETTYESVSYHQLEITYSRFEKTIRFPCPVEGATIERRYKDGLLVLQLVSPEECD